MGRQENNSEESEAGGIGSLRRLALLLVQCENLAKQRKDTEPRHSQTAGRGTERKESEEKGSTAEGENKATLFVSVRKHLQSVLFCSIKFGRNVRFLEISPNTSVKSTAYTCAKNNNNKKYIYIYTLAPTELLSHSVKLQPQNLKVVYWDFMSQANTKRCIICEITEKNWCVFLPSPFYCDALK